jgi:hypothetical protein
MGHAGPLEWTDTVLAPSVVGAASREEERIALILEMVAVPASVRAKVSGLVRQLARRAPAAVPASATPSTPGRVRFFVFHDGNTRVDFPRGVARVEVDLAGCSPHYRGAVLEQAREAIEDAFARVWETAAHAVTEAEAEGLHW